MSNVRRVDAPASHVDAELDADIHATERRERLRKGLLAIGAAVLLTALVMYLLSGRYVSTDNAYVQADKADMAAEISGVATEVLVRTNQKIKQGDVLFRIEPDQYRIALLEAEAQLAETRALVNSLKLSHRDKVTQEETAAENVSFRQREYERQLELRKRGTSSDTRVDEAHSQLTTARQQWLGVREELSAIVAQLGGDPALSVDQNPAVMRALAARDKAALDLSHTEVRAPISGTVAQVNLQPGEFVTAGRPMLTLVSDEGIWITANFKETDLTHVRPGQKASITVDRYPDLAWSASVASISPATGAEFALIPPQNATGNWVKVVQRVPVRLYLDDYRGDPALPAGLSAEVEIDTEQHSAPVQWMIDLFGG